MAESKYIKQFNILFEQVMNVKKEAFSSLKDSTKQIISEINNFINDNKNNPETKEILSNYFINQIRLKFQKEIFNNLLDEKQIISKSLLLCEYIFYIINETKFISFQQSLKFLQDIVETIPFSGLEELFLLISSCLKQLDNSLIDQGKLNILLIQNIFLKRTNNNLNSSLRGKILLLFCDLFSIIEKSGTNIKGKYSSNLINEEISVYSNDNSDTVINDDDIKMNKEEIKGNEDNNNNQMIVEEEQKDIKEEEKNEKSSETELDLSAEKNQKIKLYEQFWNIEKVMINPFMVC